MDLYSYEAERSVLGSLFIDPECYYKLENLRGRDFYHHEHEIIFNVVSRVIESDEPLDIVSVAEQHKLQLSYLGDLVKNTPTSANAKSYAKIVTDYAKKRELFKVTEQIQERLMNNEPIDSFLADAQSDIESAAQHDMVEDDTITDAAKQALFHVKQYLDTNMDGVIGAPTGLHELDQRTGGLFGARLWCVAARPSLGKTALTLQWALYSADHGHAVGICSLEMDKEELALRAIAHKQRLNISALSHGDRETYKRANIDCLPSNIYFDTKSFNLTSIVSRITEWKRKHDISYAIVDHIGLVEDGDYKNRNDQLGKVTRTFKKLTKKLNIPIVTVSQLNRNVEKENRKPKLADLRDSGNIEQDIDIGVFLHGQEVEFVGTEVELGLLKNRKGQKGWMPEKYVFDGAIQTFTVREKF